MKNKYTMILASKSPRRNELLSYLGIPFEIITQDTKEESSNSDPYLFCEDIAEVKGSNVYNALLEKKNDKNYFVISSDTIVVKEGVIFGKPSSSEIAKQTLLSLSGVEHMVITAFVFHYKDLKTDQIICKRFSISTQVTFDDIDPVVLDDYIATNDSLDKAGAYGVQGAAQVFISKINGPYSNVVGLPISNLTNELIKIMKAIFGEQENWKKSFE